MRSINLLAILAALALAATVAAQDRRPASPRGQAAVEVGGEYQERRYAGGKWIVIDYGRPILRGRTGIFGSGESYGKAVNAGAPVWRAGANKSTRLMTEAALVFGDQVLPAGEYSVFVELKEGNWTLIISTHTAKDGFREPGEGLWGAYNYTDDKDVVRLKMQVASLPVRYEQFTVAFTDMTEAGGTLSMLWDTTLATASFSIQ